MNDLDRLLATNTSFLLGKWLEDAKTFGGNEKEKKYYEHNARNIITTWGMTAQSLNDYANRSWAGLTGDYYKKRWVMFMDEVIKAVAAKKDFNEQEFQKKVTEFEWQWTLANNKFNNWPIGNPVAISKELIKKYSSSIHSK